MKPGVCQSWMYLITIQMKFPLSNYTNMGWLSIINFWDSVQNKNVRPLVQNSVFSNNFAEHETKYPALVGARLLQRVNLKNCLVSNFLRIEPMVALSNKTLYQYKLKQRLLRFEYFVRVRTSVMGWGLQRKWSDPMGLPSSNPVGFSISSYSLGRSIY